MPALYIHIPFCSSVCAYCDFCAMPVPERVQSEYIELLLRELQLRISELPAAVCENDNGNTTLYIGGGSPSHLSVADLQKLFFGLKNVLKNFDIKLERLKESTVEWNPEQVSDEKISLVADFGINRFSLGIQSLDDNILKMIGRKHTAKNALCAFEKLNEKFSTGSADLMFCLPNQNTENFLTDIKTLTDMNIKHLSFYGLTISKNSFLKQQIDKGKIPAPNEDLYAEMYLKGVEQVCNGNLRRYEVSNFALPNHESLHNYSYWKQEDYLGIGLSAHSSINGVRSHSPLGFSGWKNWVKNGCKNSELYFDLPNTNGKKLEMIYLSLRTRDGLSLLQYEQKFGEKFDLERVAPFLKKGYIALNSSKNGDFLALQGEGWLWLDKIAIEI